MINRDAKNTLQRLAQSYPVLVITGPRQSGKTTLAQSLFGSHLPYANLEKPDTREFAAKDPNGFFSKFPKGAIIDECQLCPSIFPHIQALVDERKQNGEFVLTGSQNFDLLSKVSESLAGRASIVDLLPLTFSELSSSSMAPITLDEMLFKGGYPAIYDRPVDPLDWYEDYIRTYLERDVRQLINVTDLSRFQRFLRLCAGRSAQLLNYADLQNDAGISFQTLKQWLSVLEASYLIFLLQPHHKNFSKRLVKSPKLYFYDTGLMCRLLGIQSSQQIETHPLRGAIFETWTIAEIKKMGFNRHRPFNCFFWRDHKGLEIDLIIEEALGLRPIEIKSAATIQDEFFSGLNHFQTLAKNQSLTPALLFGGETSQERQGIPIYSWREIDSFGAKYLLNQDPINK